MTWHAGGIATHPLFSHTKPRRHEEADHLRAFVAPCEINWISALRARSGNGAFWGGMPISLAFHLTTLGIPGTGIPAIPGTVYLSRYRCISVRTTWHAGGVARQIQFHTKPRRHEEVDYLRGFVASCEINWISALRARCGAGRCEAACQSASRSTSPPSTTRCAGGPLPESGRILVVSGVWRCLIRRPWRGLSRIPRYG
jgi:hypothetical protein